MDGGMVMSATASRVALVKAEDRRQWNKLDKTTHKEVSNEF
jgi:hypothetical protein